MAAKFKKLNLPLTSTKF